MAGTHPPVAAHSLRGDWWMEERLHRGELVTLAPVIRQAGRTANITDIQYHG
jgi:hypothetical protein